MAKKSSSTLLILGVIILSTLLMVACNNIHPIVGTWNCSMIEFTFNKDGTLLITSESSDLNISGTYELIDDNSISVSHSGSTYKADISINNDVLTITEGTAIDDCNKIN